MLLNKSPSLETRNIIAIAFLSLVESLQLLIIVAFIYHFIPIPPAPFVKKLFPVYLPEVRPKRDFLLFHIFIAVAIVLQALFLYFWRNKLNDKILQKKILTFATVSALGIGVQLFAAFKILVVPQGIFWPKFLFCLALASSMLIKIFFPKFLKSLKAFYSRCLVKEIPQALARGADIAILFLMIFLIFPDIERALARNFTYDQFYSFDSLIMAPGWAYIKGCVLNIDVTSQYSVVIAPMVMQLAKAGGGVTYQNALWVLFIATVVYLVTFYAFLRYWLKSILLAGFGLYLFIKWNMFHWGIFPLVWVFPSTLPTRYFFDVIVLFFLYRHLCTQRISFLWLAAGVCGMALAYMLDTGVYLTLTLYVYLLLRLKDIDRWSLLGMAFLPVLMALCVLWIFVGSWVFTAAFWHNATEFVRLFMNGWGALPMGHGLKDGYYFAFVMGFIIPVVYVATVMYQGALYFFNKASKEKLFIVIVCVYGLALYHYYIHRSGMSSYYVVCMPFVMTLLFWLKEFLNMFDKSFQRIAGGGLFIFSLGALLTNTLFAYYPNVLTLAQHDWAREKEFFKQQFAFHQDADLIRWLTSPQEKVALISSFETEILREADRAPFFYYFPLVVSKYMNTPELGGTYLHTTQRMEKTLNQLHEQKPAYVFIEKKIFLTRGRFQTMDLLVKDIEKYYEPYAQGQYLLALKRK